MTLSYNHSGNLPTFYYDCPVCKSKTSVHFTYVGNEDKSKIRISCKVCKHIKQIEKEQFLGVEEELKLFPYK